MEEKEKKLGLAIGIDLGTTNSVMGLYTGDVKIIQSREGENIVPSAVMWDAKNKDFIVGKLALNQAVRDPSQLVLSIKRLMGNSLNDKNVQEMINKPDRYPYKIARHSKGTVDSIGVTLGGKEFFPEEISAMILHKIKEDAEYSLGKPVTHAVITVPAYFSEVQRTATYNAGVLAGFRVMNIFDEPTSSAIAYGMENLQPGEVKNLLVYDLGGGTFDVSVLMASAGSFSVVRTGGDKWLAGDNFDEKIMGCLRERINTDYGVDIYDQKYDELQRNINKYVLRIKSRETKEQLSSLNALDIILALRTPDKDLIDISLRLTREEFENMINSMIEKTIEITLETIEKGGLKPEEIDKVLMVGGSTRIPLVQKKVETVFGREKIVRDNDPMLCVATGATIIAGRINQIICPKDKTQNEPMSEKCVSCGFEFTIKVPEENKVSRNSPFTYGVQSLHDKFNPFVEADVPFPLPGDPLPPPDCRKREFHTVVDDQRMIRIPVFGGENLESASKNERQGEAFAFLPPNLPKNTPFQIRLWLDTDGKFLLDVHLIRGSDLIPLHTEILRHELFAQIVDELGEAENLWAKIKAEKTKNFEKKKEIMQMRDELYEEFKKSESSGEKAQEKAVGKVGKYKRKLEEYNQESTKVTEEFAQEEWKLFLAQAILQRYHFMLSPDTSLKLGELTEKLRRAVTEQDKKQAQAITEELDDLFQTDTVVSWGLTFIIVNARLQQLIYSLRAKFPEQYQRVLALKNDFDRAEEMLKKQNFNEAINIVVSIDAELTNLEKDIPVEPGKEEEQIICMSEECKKNGGTKNSKYITRCKVCGANLTFTMRESLLGTP